MKSRKIKENFKLLESSGSYDPKLERDACGVGLIASTEGKKSRSVVEYGIEALKAVWHRGAVDADGKTGDGAGIHVEIPRDFFIEKINPDNDAYWQIDSKESRNVKSFCCLHSNARDFSRLGKLYIDNGSWHGSQIIDSTFIQKSTKPYLNDFKEYGIGVWLSDYKDLKISLMSGHQGQYVIMIPEKKLIITRLGERDIDLGRAGVSPDVLVYIDEALKLIN